MLTTPADVASPEPEPEHETEVADAAIAGPYLRWGLALLSIGAGTIHFAFAPGHFSESWTHGTFFVVIGWFQILWGLGVLLRPTPGLMRLGLLNAAVLAVWLVSRTAGLPVGPESGQSEAVGFPDALASGFEVLIVAGSFALGLRPGLATRPLRSASFLPGAAAFMSVAVAASTGVALTPRFASEHHQGDTGGQGVAAGGHAHDAGAAGAAQAAAVPTPFAAGESPCEKAGPAASKGQLQQSAEGGHSTRGPHPQVALDLQTTLVLQQQQQQAREVATRFPNVAAAEAAGYRKSTGYVPCIGAHYTNIGLVPKFDPAAPSELLFDGTTPDARIVGLSYLVFHRGGPPEGFAGPNDQWHQHNMNGGLCIGKAGVVVGNEETTPEQCTARGGAKVKLDDIWMVHDWVVPGFDCSWGVFAGECPELGGRRGATAWVPSGPQPQEQLAPPAQQAAAPVPAAPR